MLNQKFLSGLATDAAARAETIALQIGKLETVKPADGEKLASDLLKALATLGKIEGLVGKFVNGGRKAKKTEP